MTKTQTRAQLRRLTERLGDLIAEFRDLQCEIGDLREEVEETSSNIEPYEGYNDLTPEQEERQEWLDNLACALEEVENMDIEDPCYELEDYLDA